MLHCAYDNILYVGVIVLEEVEPDSPYIFQLFSECEKCGIIVLLIPTWQQKVNYCTFLTHRYCNMNRLNLTPINAGRTCKSSPWFIITLHGECKVTGIRLECKPGLIERFFVKLPLYPSAMTKIVSRPKIVDDLTMICQKYLSLHLHKMKMHSSESIVTNLKNSARECLSNTDKKKKKWNMVHGSYYE